MGLFDQFPYTNTHELNLDWLMRTMKELRTAYDGLQTDIKEINDFIDNFESWFNENVDQKIDDRIEVQMAYYLQRLVAVEALVKQLEDEINQDDGVIGQIDQLKTAVQNLQTEIFNLKMTYEDRFNDLIELMHNYKNSMDGYIDSKAEALEQYIKSEVTKLDRLDVVNPITGVFEDIQNVLNEIVNVVTNSYGLTAAQYDALQLTAHVYDGYRITAYDYSTRGYFELYLKLTQNLMRSPFTGDMDTYENVIYALSNLHKCSLTAQGYDERQITAENFDKMVLTAFMYDWFGYQVMNFVTAKLYDSLQLTAQEYDEKLITAAQYEEGMHWLVDMSLKCNSSCNNIWILANQIQDITHQLENVKQEVEEIPRAMTTGNGISYVGRVLGQMTAFAYDQLKLTANQYDGYQITAENYDDHASQYLDPQVVLDGAIVTRTIVPELQEDSIVLVYSEESGILPLKIARYGTTVETTWPATVKDMLFTVTVQNKQSI